MPPEPPEHLLILVFSVIAAMVCVTVQHLIQAFECAPEKKLVAEKDY